MISSLPTDGQTLLDVKLLSRLKNNLEFSQNQVHLEIFKILSPEMCPLTFLWSSELLGAAFTMVVVLLVLHVMDLDCAKFLQGYSVQGEKVNLHKLDMTPPKLAPCFNSTY